MENRERGILIVGGGRSIGRASAMHEIALACNIGSMAQVVHVVANNCNDKLETIHKQNGEIPRRMSDFVLHAPKTLDNYFTPPLTRKERRAQQRKNNKR